MRAFNMTFQYDPSAFNFIFKKSKQIKFDREKGKFVYVEVNKDKALIIEGIVINFCGYRGENG